MKTLDDQLSFQPKTDRYDTDSDRLTVSLSCLIRGKLLNELYFTETASLKLLVNTS